MIQLQNEKIKEASYYLIHTYNFWSEVFLACNISENKTIPTTGVNVTEKGMNFVYNTEFINNLPQSEINFLILHEILHLVCNHSGRIHQKALNHHVGNVVGDMIINTEIKNHFCKQDKVNTIKNEEDEDVGYFIPEDYKGEHTLEKLYEWYVEKHPEETEQIKKKGENTDSYGYSELDKENIDVHIEDTVTEEEKEVIVSELIDRAKNRGTLSADMEEMINRLRPSRKNYIRMIKSSISGLGSSQKQKTWKRFSSRGDLFRGRVKYKKMFNIILDVSGSMHGSFEKALSYIFHSGYEVNMFQVDTEIKAIEKIKTKTQMNKLRIQGCGGTTIQPAIDKIVERYNKYSTIILTDGYTDDLKLLGLNNKVLILSTETKCPISNGQGKVTQIVIKD
ncbi:MAG: VWA-like domain-containing protein [Candidatus Woesearchaeota archaeon]|jgi:predicted metal-dependent peptidase|nr:VWA-like domain-containing protein [Candidatus Woesearchaeota archaeon]